MVRLFVPKIDVRGTLAQYMFTTLASDNFRQNVQSKIFRKLSFVAMEQS